MRKSVVWIGLVLLLSSSHQDEKRSNSAIKLNEPKSSIGTEENPQARAEFELMKIRDPKTGTVPANIRQKEINFSQTIPTRNQLANQRSESLKKEVWELAGPVNVGGRTRAVALDIQNKNTIVAGGVSGGIWRSTNGGSSWSRTSDLENRNSVTTIAQDTRVGAENVWYYGTGELSGNSARGGGAPYRGDGIFKSTDGGQSWSQLASTKDADPSVFGSQFQYIWRIVTNHKRSDADELIVAAYGGILRSVDGGNSWMVMIGEELNNLPDDSDLNDSVAPFYTEIAKNADGHFYASLSHTTSTEDVIYSEAGFYWSANGADWYHISPPEFSSLSLSRTVISAGGNEAYFYSNFNDFTYLFKYKFTGIDASGSPKGNWSDLSNNLPKFEGIGQLDVQGGYNMAIKVDPNNPDLVFLGGTNLYRSSDGFESNNNIDWIGGYAETEGISVYENHHPDQHDVLFIPSKSSALLSINDGGLFLTNNSSASSVSWSSLNNGYITSQFYTVSIPKSETSDLIIGGLQDNGSLINTSGSKKVFWKKILGGDGAYAATTSQGLYWYASFQKSQIYRLTLNSNYDLTSSARVDPTDGASKTDSEYLFINPYVLDAINPNIMYLAGGNAIWRNNNLAQVPSGSQETTDVNWDLITTTILSEETITALEITNDSEFLYYGTNSSGFFRLETPSLKGEETKKRLSLIDGPESSHVSCISANPENGAEVLTIFSNYGIPSIFHSADAGETFEDVGGNLEQFIDGTGNGPSIRWGEIVPLQGGGTRYFVGTSVGLYSTDILEGTATTWLKEGEETIGKAVVMMMDYRPLDGAFVVATHGNGVFRTNINGFKKIDPKTTGTEKFRISNVFPNPFKDVMTIEMDIPQSSYMTVDIYDMFGKHVRNLIAGQQFGGKNTVSWDGKSQGGVSMRDGMYMYRIIYNGQIEVGRIVYDR